MSSLSTVSLARVLMLLRRPVHSKAFSAFSCSVMPCACCLKQTFEFFLIWFHLLFIVKEQIGKWFVIVWHSMWFAIQFICHEWYAIFNDGFMSTLEKKRVFFRHNTVVTNRW